MDDRDRDPASKLAMVLLRYLHDWDQGDLARASRTAPSQVSAYDRGERDVPREVLERMAAAADFPANLLDALLWLLRSFLVAAQGRSHADRVLGEGVAGELIALIRLAEDVILAPLRRRATPGASRADREEAAALWERLKPRAPAERRLLVEEAREYQSWALCERVAAESLTLAANQPRQALELAELALRIGELAPGEVAWRQRLQGYALFHVANARRVCNDVPAGETALSRAGRLWQEGAPGDPGLLNAAVPLWIEAAFRRDQRRFPEALKRIDEALALDSGELRARMLLSKSAILEILGDSNGATAALAEAAPLIDVAREPRLALVLRFNLLVDLCHLERAAEAAPKLREVRELAEQLGEELDLVRVVWLEGKVAAGLGQSAEARAAFAQARREFRARELAYDYALVSLDLSLVLLTSGRPGDVRRLAEEMVWIFSAQGIHREALAALQVFCTAAREEVATIELTSRVRRFLYRAQHDRELRFGQEEGAASQ